MPQTVGQYPILGNPEYVRAILAPKSHRSGARYSGRYVLVLPISPYIGMTKDDKMHRDPWSLVAHGGTIEKGT